MEKLSVCIISQNEEQVIARCLASVAWADEIIVVDAYSTDQTKAICLNPKAEWAAKIRFYQEEWRGFRLARMKTLSLASHEWVFVMDSDEACTPELATRIKTILQKNEFDAYKVKRNEYFIGKQIRYGIWNPSYQDRLFKKTGVEYINDIHEYPKFHSEPGRIHEPIEHSPDFSIVKFLYKMNKYTSVEVRERYVQGQRTNVIHLLGAFPAMFLKNYFYYKAYKDGWHGVVISLLEGVSRVVRHVKLWEMERLDRDKQSLM